MSSTWTITCRPLPAPSRTTDAFTFVHTGTPSERTTRSSDLPLSTSLVTSSVCTTSASSRPARSRSLWPTIWASSRFTSTMRPSSVTSATPMGAFSNAVRKRSSLSRSSRSFSYRSTNTCTFERRIIGSNGLTT